jgi:non-ribosomal peptide synthetase component F
VAGLLPGGQLTWNQCGIGFSCEELLSKLEVNGVSFAVQQKRVSTGGFDIRLSCIQSENSIAVELHYDLELFALEDIERFAGEFLALLDSTMQEPSQAIGRLEILSAQERAQILGFNDSSRSSSVDQRRRDGRIDEWFSQEAEKRPDSIAVVYENEHLTYRELATRTNQLAEYLQSVGVKPDTLVVCVERSWT